MLLAIHVTFFINKNFAFRGYNARYRWYLAGQLKALIINFIAFEVFLALLGEYLHGQDIAFVLAALMILFFNFTYSRMLAFRRD